MENQVYFYWRGNKIPRLVLGTAQLGMNYGIANQGGRPSLQGTLDIISAAWENGVTFFDTAQGYGDSEKALGAACDRLGLLGRANFISKISPELNPLDTKAIDESIACTCGNLSVDSLWALMLHRAGWLDYWDRGLGQCLLNAKESGVIRYIGVSVCSAEEAERALGHADIDFLQVPCNIWDQRMLTGGVFSLARKKDKFCFVRSIYLQGLLTMRPEAVGRKLPIAQTAAKRWQGLCAVHGITPNEAAVQFAMSLGTSCVIGAETSEQVRNNCALFRRLRPDPDIIAKIGAAMNPYLNDTILNPGNWGQ